jgi:hypothetical protein
MPTIPFAESHSLFNPVQPVARLDADTQSALRRLSNTHRRVGIERIGDPGVVGAIAILVVQIEAIAERDVFQPRPALIKFSWEPRPLEMSILSGQIVHRLKRKNPKPPEEPWILCCKTFVTD